MKTVIKKALKWGAIGLGGIVVLGIIAALIPDNAPDTTPQEQQEVTQQEEPKEEKSNERVNVGEEGVVRTDGTGMVVVARTEEAFDAIIKAAVAGDTRGMAEIVLAGDAFLVEQGTKVLVIDSNVGERRVRILDGMMINETGWVAMEWVVRP